MDDDFARHKKAYDNQEKIAEALKLIEKFVQSGTYVSYATPRIWLKEIKEILEK